MSELNNTMHQPVRLQIMASLVALAAGEQVDFVYLRDLLNLSDGNMGAHLTKLEDEGFVKTKKTFIARKPRTFIAATDKGIEAFDKHVSALEAIIRAAR